LTNTDIPDPADEVSRDKAASANANAAKALAEDKEEADLRRRGANQKIRLRNIAFSLGAFIVLFFAFLLFCSSWKMSTWPQHYNSLAVTLPLIGAPILALTSLMGALIVAAFREPDDGKKRKNKDEGSSSLKASTGLIDAVTKH